MDDISPTSGPASGPSQPLCKVCNARYAIYTCPRCRIRTCSLPCSSRHKTTTKCSGERDKAAYVKMRDYTWGTLMSDYTYLEDVGRKVGEWGAIIVKGAYANPQTGRDAHGMRGRGMRGGRVQRGRAGRHTGGPKTKRDILKTQLEMHDISMDLLPLGMERRQHNQSIWDYKNQTAYLTLEFKFHPPQDPTTSRKVPPFTFLTHRNNIKTPLLSLVANQVRERRNFERKRENGKGKQKAAAAEGDDHVVEKSAFPPWLLELVEQIPNSTPDSENTTFSPFDSLIRAPVPQIPPTALTITGTRIKAAYHRVVPAEPLFTALRNTSFIEYPTMELWPQGEFSGIVADQHAEPAASGVAGFGQRLIYEQGDAPKDDTDESAKRRAKRQKIELKAGKKAISELLGEYGSEDESGQEEEQKAEKDDRAQNGLTMLGVYADSDEEGKIEVDSDEDDDGLEVSPEVLLELMKKAQGHGSWLEDSKDERVDWGDDDTEGEEEE